MIDYIPNSIKIGNINYKVIVTDKPIIVDDKTNFLGTISYDNSEITIKSDLTKDKKIEVLWHEILHGITDYFNIDFEKDSIERIVDCIGKGVYQVLKDNKKDE